MSRIFEDPTWGQAPGNPIPKMSVGQYLGELTRRAGPMHVVAGPGVPPTDGRAAVAAPADDPELLERTKHVRLKGEPMMGFYARIGLGAAQIMQMSKSEITRFVETVEKNREDTERPAKSDLEFAPKSVPPRFIITP